MEIKQGMTGNPTYGDDMTNWMVNASKGFICTNAWEKFRVRKDLAPWHEIIWHKYSILRHPLITWMAMKQRLITKDKLV